MITCCQQLMYTSVNDLKTQDLLTFRVLKKKDCKECLQRNY